MDAIRAHNFRTSTNLGSRSYAKLRNAFPALRDLPSLQKLQTRIAALSGVKPVAYHCCINSCCCYTRAYAALEECPYCNEPRYDSSRHPRRIFEYLPIIPRLVNLFLDEKFAKAMNYRHDYPYQHGPKEDVFDGRQYAKLCQTKVTIGDVTLPHRFFEQITDIALGLSADGVGPYQKRGATCWPLILVNYNLPPELRYKLVNILCAGVIPGPKEPKDMDSFLAIIVDELLELARGVSAYNRHKGEVFSLRAYLILVFGDMPAIAKLMRMKGPNGISPCRACRIQGVRDPEKKRVTTHCTPLHRDNGESYDPLKLPLRSHEQFIRQAVQVSTAHDNAEAGRRATQFGINGVPILAMLSSLSFPNSFPHGFMHAIIENVFTTLIDLWTTDYKNLDQGSEEYRLLPSVVEAIGEVCVQSGATMPAVFGACVPNIATQRHWFKAESWLLFSTVLGPVLLQRQFRRPQYYAHFIDLVLLVNKCLQMSLTDTNINEIKQGFAKWVLQYERYVKTPLVKTLHSFALQDLLSV
jgi:hypothetical protein